MAILFDTRDGIARITINRPEVLNALDPATYAEITDAFEQIERDPDILVGIVTGAGDKAFTAGADLKIMHTGAADLRRLDAVAAGPLGLRGNDLQAADRRDQRVRAGRRPGARPGLRHPDRLAERRLRHARGEVEPAARLRRLPAAADHLAVARHGDCC